MTYQDETKNNVQTDIEEGINKLSDKLMKSFTKRSIRDVEKILDINNSKFSDVTYAVFRGYCLGYSIGNLKKTVDKIDNMNNIKEENK